MVKGTIREIGGQYFLQTSGLVNAKKKELIQIGSTAEKEKYASLVGQQVEVVLSEPVRSIVALIPNPDEISPPRPRPFPCYLIMCYIPAPWFRVFMRDEKLITPLAEQFLNEGILSKANYDKVMNKIK
jgi:hypothetical protein